MRKKLISLLPLTVQLNYAVDWIEKMKIIDDTGGEMQNFVNAISSYGNYMIISPFGCSATIYQKNVDH